MTPFELLEQSPSGLLGRTYLMRLRHAKCPDHHIVIDNRASIIGGAAVSVSHWSVTSLTLPNMVSGALFSIDSQVFLSLLISSLATD